MTDKELVLEILKRIPVCSENTIQNASKNAETKEKAISLANKYLDDHISQLIIIMLGAQIVKDYMPLLNLFDRIKKV